ncbi:hypothetical protein [Vibrio lentus]|uniref:hypothetical protein n=1 Tax=Vibrio lentus TaxID=136468 RepID=UPI000C83A832|nr:hypothetical protein [Vibrio lentus]PML09416.1 hypothetical protein BCT85_16430 [Vibrio lentus]
METIVGLSNFSFDLQKFNMFSEIESQLAKLKSLQGQFTQHKVSLAIASDILKDNYFGHSIETQFNNFSFGKDKIIIGSFKARLERGYFNGFNRTYTGEELKNLALSPDEGANKCCTLFTPIFSITGPASFRNPQGFSDYYEKILGEYPVSEESYFERATSHFTNVTYHDECEATLSRVTDGFCNYSIAITKCLQALNELSPMSGSNIRKHLQDIAAKAQYACTPEGSSHDHFKFTFKYEGTDYPKLGCQFHIKPSDRNMKGDGSHNHKRIYFGFIPLDGDKLKIAVAAIGPHITTHNSADRYAPERIKRKKVRNRGNS